jgi:hypothetical protein
MEQTVAQVTLSGLTQLQQLGLAGILGSFLLIGLAVAIWHCERRTKDNQQAYREDAKANREVLQGVTEAINGVNLTIAELKGRIDK